MNNDMTHLSAELPNGTWISLPLSAWHNQDLVQLLIEDATGTKPQRRTDAEWKKIVAFCREHADRIPPGGDVK